MKLQSLEYFLLNKSFHALFVVVEKRKSVRQVIEGEPNAVPFRAKSSILKKKTKKTTDLFIGPLEIKDVSLPCCK